MAITIQSPQRMTKRNSSATSILDEQASPQKLSRSKSSYEKEVDACARWGELVDAWKAGRFNSSDAQIEDAIEEFFHPDAVLDVASTGGHTGFFAFKSYYGKRGCDTIKDWFAFVDEFTPDGMQLAYVPGPTAGEVWSTYETSKSTHKLTGKGVAASIVFVSTWEDSRCRKITVAYENASAVAAICSFLDVPIPKPIEVPAFDPHPKPRKAWDRASKQWTDGAFRGAKTKEAALEKWVAADVLVDARLPMLPERFKLYRGRAGFDAWVNGVMGELELSNVALSATSGLKPGCVLQRISFDAEHKTTAKKAKSVQMYAELAYNTDGQLVYAKHFMLKPESLTAIYGDDSDARAYV